MQIFLILVCAVGITYCGSQWNQTGSWGKVGLTMAMVILALTGVGYLFA